jgi:two-component system alkaline phosphatase synthesis response regulator PhoP
VLIVDHSEDSREVLRTALERRGVRTLEATEARQGMELARQFHPQVIVLDVDADAADDEHIRRQYCAESHAHDAYLVLLGRSVDYERALPRDRVVPKPYHYAPLIRTIEALLALECG